MLKLLKEYVNLLLTEAKSDQLKSRYPHLEDEVDELVSGGVETKYLDWAVRQLNNQDEQVSTEETIELLKYFHKNIQRISKKDINSYKNLEALRLELESLSKSNRQKVRETLFKGSERVGETEDYKVYYVNDYEASATLGKGTKWCISGRNLGDNYFWDYYFAGARFYFCISKTDLGEIDPSYKKIAIVIKPGGIEVFDSYDSHINDHGKVSDLISISKEDYYLNKRDRINIGDFVNYPSDAARERAAENADEQNDQGALLQFAKDKLTKIRRIAVEKIDQKHLIDLFEEEEDSIAKRTIARRLGGDALIGYINHNNPEFRFFAAENVDPKYLPQLMKDTSDSVRRVVSKRIDPEHLPKMMDEEDDDDTVRLNIAERIDTEYLPEMMLDISSMVRRVVVNRINPVHLHRMIDDPEAFIRVAVAKRIDPEYLPQMLKDANNTVRMTAQSRLKKMATW